MRDARERQFFAELMTRSRQAVGAARASNCKRRARRQVAERIREERRAVQTIGSPAFERNGRAETPSRPGSRRSGGHTKYGRKEVVVLGAARAPDASARSCCHRSPK